MNGHPHGEQLSAYIDGMLDVAQTHEVAAHLVRCPQCRAVHAGLQETKQLLAAMQAPAQPAPEFWTAAYRQMRVADQARSGSVGTGWRAAWQEVFQVPQRRWSAGFAAAAVIAAAIAAPLMNNFWPTAPHPAIVSAQALPDFVDVSSLVQAHTESAARQPLADPDRQDMIAMDASFSTDDASMSPSDMLDAGSNASP